MNKPVIVVKIGTNLLTTPERRLDVNNLRDLVYQICDELDRKEARFVIVTSGAITCGSETMALIPESIPEKQAAAAVGQILLMQEYARFFGQRGYSIGQLLLTKDGIDNEIAKVNAQNTLTRLLHHGVIPIINENDSIATNEIGPKFGDNDELSAVVARLVHASRLILLSDIDGVYRDNPKENPTAELIPQIDQVDESIFNLAKDRENGRSRGGMKSKLNAAKEASEAGIEVWIANGRKRVIPNIQINGAIGTRIVRKELR
ncbi:glutamate 5-kinase [bacterium]|nr:glutamate 5-kinase [bacterium]